MGQHCIGQNAIRALFRQDCVHRDVYLSREIFDLERERLFAQSWLFAGHSSQIPRAGDFVTTEILGYPLLLVRRTDGSIGVLANRCAHKGAMITSKPCGNAGRAFRCPYHGWSYRLDGSLLGVPMQAGYEGTAMREGEAGAGLLRIASAEHRGFIFIRLSASGSSFEEYLRYARSFLDLMADRSPCGMLEVAGERLRTIIRCNWKIYLENINDTLHVHAAHEASAHAAGSVWAKQPQVSPKPMAIEQMLPFQSGNEFMDGMGGRVFASGHSIIGTNVSIHSGYGEVADYIAAMEQAYGPERTRQILSFTPQNVIFYPSIAFKASPLTMRVIRPLDVDRTEIEAWAFRAVGAPKILAQRSITYNRIAFSPMSLIAQDDVHVFETVQKALQSPGKEWVSLHRGFRPEEVEAEDLCTSGTNELLMRNQFRAWSRLMCADWAESALA